MWAWWAAHTATRADTSPSTPDTSDGCCEKLLDSFS